MQDYCEYPESTQFHGDLMNGSDVRKAVPASGNAAGPHLTSIAPGIGMLKPALTLSMTTIVLKPLMFGLL
jgi:hypothetical protein